MLGKLPDRNQREIFRTRVAYLISLQHKKKQRYNFVSDYL